MAKLLAKTWLTTAALLLAFAMTLPAQSQDADQSPESQKESFRAPVAQGSCLFNAVAYKVMQDQHPTSSSNFRVVPDSSIFFTQGSGSDCVIVTFAAEASAQVGSTTMTVEAYLDGVACSPRTLFFVRSNTTIQGSAARSMTYVCKNVAPGSHNVHLKWKSNNGKFVFLGYRTVTVQYFQAP